MLYYFIEVGSIYIVWGKKVCLVVNGMSIVYIGIYWNYLFYKIKINNKIGNLYVIDLFWKLY